MTWTMSVVVIEGHSAFFTISAHLVDEPRDDGAPQRKGSGFVKADGT